MAGEKLYPENFRIKAPDYIVHVGYFQNMATDIPSSFTEHPVRKKTKAWLCRLVISPETGFLFQTVQKNWFDPQLWITIVKEISYVGTAAQVGVSKVDMRVLCATWRAMEISHEILTFKTVL